ncbi:MAG: pectinacetylesterase family protein, partial [Anaerolineae bacterium]|nr:pectinacetylesterase family protein [Anaerolineae bacterium]
MRTMMLYICCLVLLLGVPAAAQPDLPNLADLQPDTWNRIDPGGDTICAESTPYAFFVRPVSESNHLLIYFQGGGACWNTFTCGTMSTFDPSVAADEVYTGGIFDLENPANPLLDYNMVFIPYCTADVFTGNRSVTYGDDLTIEHRGYVNTQAVLNWAYEQFPQPSQVLVTGSSAGALGAIFHAADIMAHYADVPVIQLGDGYVGLLPENA